MNHSSLVLPPGFADIRQVGRSGGSAIFAGTQWGEPAFAKLALGTSVQRAAQFGRELAAYRFFAQHRPPLTVPRLLAADEGAGVIVLSAVPGHQVSADRHPGHLDDLSVLARIFTEVRGLDSWEFDRRDLAIADWRVDYEPRLERLRRYGLIADDAEFVALRRLLDISRSLPWVIGHGDLELSNILHSPAGFAYVGWGSAGGYLPGFDLALLWVLLGRVLGPRRVIEEIIPPAIKPAFWLNVVLLLARELRTYSSHRPSAQRDVIVARLRADWDFLRERSWIGA